MRERHELVIDSASTYSEEAGPTTQVPAHDQPIFSPRVLHWIRGTG